MRKEKLFLAAEAAGYAMVNADDYETMTPEGSKNSDSEKVRVVETTTTDWESPKRQRSLAEEWFGYFMSRPAAR